MRYLFLISLTCLASHCYAADETPKVANSIAEAIRPPLEFKDLTPPELIHEKEPVNTAHDLHSEHHQSHEGFSCYAEYLLMRPRRGAFDFALHDPNRDLTPSGRLEHLNYELRSGARIGFNYTGFGGWDSRFQYTFFRSAADRSITAPAGGTLYATLSRPGLNEEALSSQASASLEFNQFDWHIGKKIYRDEQASARMFGGLSWASIRQEMQANYDGRDANRGNVTIRNDFNGFGVMAGLEGQLNVTKHWFIYGRGAGGLFTGLLETPIRETNNAGLTTYADLDIRSRRVVPMMNLAIGGGWQSGRVTIRAGYEIQHWFNLIDQPRFIGELAEARMQSRTGDFSMEGLFVHFGLTF